MILGRVFLLIELILKLVGLWNEFADYVQVRKQIEDRERQRRRNEAIDKSKKAESEDDIWKSQDGIVDNNP